MKRDWADEISDAVGDEFGWCDFGGHWCTRHDSMRFVTQAARCDAADDVYRAAEKAVESVLAAIARGTQ